MLKTIDLDCLQSHELGDVLVGLAQLSLYAAKRQQAMQARERYNPLRADRLERECDALYETLPDWARW